MHSITVRADRHQAGTRHDDDELTEIANQIVEHGMDAVIATNTTLERSKVSGHKHATETGGLSGAPLTELATEKVRVLAKAVDGRIPVIGVGGIMSAADAIDKIRAGASLVQIYLALSTVAWAGA